MPRRKDSCPECGRPKLAIAKTCRPCSKPYERTPERREHMSRCLTGKPHPWAKGVPRPDVGLRIAASWTPERRAEARARGRALANDPDWRARIAASLSGPKNPNWTGGLARTKYAPGFTKKLKALIRERDGYICQLCGVAESDHPTVLTIHHSDYDKSNHAHENLFAVCKACNSRVNTNRDVWRGYFLALRYARDKGWRPVIEMNVIDQRVGQISIARNGGPSLADLFG